MNAPMNQPNDLQREFNLFYAKMTRYTDGRIEAVSSQAFADRVNDREETAKFRSEVVERFDKIETRLTNVEQYQRDLLGAFQATTRDILSSIANGFAAQAEQINEIKVTITMLVQKVNDLDERIKKLEK